MTWRYHLYGTCKLTQKLPTEKSIQIQNAAALKVGMKRNTLKDYLTQLRNGNYYKFNFQDNKNENIGTLR